MVLSSSLASSCATGVVTNTALSLCALTSESASSSFASVVLSVWLKMIQPAFSIWSLKNSPKFFIYILHLFTSATTVKLLSSISFAAESLTVLITSESFPTPEGSMITRSGAYSSITFPSASLKSPTSEQQMHPEFISVILMPASLRNPPSMPISPNSFSIRTSFSPSYASLMSLFIRVVFPAPKKPEIISIFVITSRAPRALSFKKFQGKDGALPSLP